MQKYKESVNFFRGTENGVGRGARRIGCHREGSPCFNMCFHSIRSRQRRRRAGVLDARYVPVPGCARTEGRGEARMRLCGARGGAGRRAERALLREAGQRFSGVFRLLPGRNGGGGGAVIYLDAAATTLQKPDTVRLAVLWAMQRCASVGRGGHPPAMEAAESVYRCRQIAAELFGAEAEQVVFTMNGDARAEHRGTLAGAPRRRGRDLGVRAQRGLATADCRRGGTQNCRPGGSLTRRTRCAHLMQR